MNALKRNSTGEIKHRELPAGERQRRGSLELALELLPEILRE